MKKLLILSLLLLGSLIRATPQDLEESIRLTTELNRLEKEATHATYKANCCYTAGCCTEIAAGYFAQNITRPYHINPEQLSTPAYAISLYVGTLLGCLGYGFTHQVSYPSSKDFREQATELRNSADRIRSRLATLPAVTMVSTPNETVRHR